MFTEFVSNTFINLRVTTKTHSSRPISTHYYRWRSFKSKHADTLSTLNESNEMALNIGNSNLNISIAVEKEMLQSKSVERVWSYGAKSVIAEVEPPQRSEINEGADLNVFQLTFAQVQVF